MQQLSIKILYIITFGTLFFFKKWSIFCWNSFILVKKNWELRGYSQISWKINFQFLSHKLKGKELSNFFPFCEQLIETAHFIENS